MDLSRFTAITANDGFQQVTSGLAGHHEKAATLKKAQIYLKRFKKDMSTLQNPPQKCHLFEALDFRTYVQSQASEHF